VGAEEIDNKTETATAGADDENRPLHATGHLLSSPP
jgi:hypothetical protein